MQTQYEKRHGKGRLWRVRRICLAAALAFSMALPAMGVAFAVDPMTPSGIIETKDRTLTIWAKDSSKIAASESQMSYFSDTTADALPNISGERRFTIAKIHPKSTDLSKIIPGNLTTYDEYAKLYYETVGQQIKINFSNPTDLSKDGNGYVVLETGKVSSTGTDASYSADIPNGYSNWFVEPAAGQHTADYATADGVYLIRDVGKSGWWAVVEIPTYTMSLTSKVEDGINHATNYEPVVYAKVADALRPQFNSYVNIIDKPDSAGKGTPTARFADRRVWETDGIAKGSANTFTAAFTLNGMAEEVGMLSQVAFGFGYFDAAGATVDTMAFNTSSSYGGYNFPYLTIGNKNANKIITRSNNVDVGVIVSDVDDPTHSTYLSLANNTHPGTGTAQSFGGAYTPLKGIMCYSGSGTNQFCAFNSQDGFIASTNTMGIGVFVPRDAPEGGQSNITEAVAYAICNPGDITLEGYNFDDPIVAGSLSEYNTNGYTKTTEVFSRGSNIKVEIALTVRTTITGSALKAGNVPANNVKPFLYGTTYYRDQVRTDDFSTFYPTNVTANSTWLTKEQLKMPEQGVDYDKYAQVYTGAVNAVKTNQTGSTLQGAKFLLMKNEGGTNYFAGSASTDVAGITWVTAAPNGTASNMLVSESSATGKVSFEGLDPDADSPTQGEYYLVEFSAPTGFKDLAHGDLAVTPALPDYGGVKVKAVTLGWDDNVTAAAKDSSDPAYAAITTVINVPKLALPNTGGVGLLRLLLIGIGLLVIGVIARRKARGALAADEGLPVSANGKARRGETAEEER